MLIVFSVIFVADTKIIFCYNFIALLITCCQKGKYQNTNSYLEINNFYLREMDINLERTRCFEVPFKE